ncbi:MAG: UDP-3-O-(3-hydroxymyristoyl)glucosamine N-acyltransferase [Candidatus Saganbacteria bacterium]|nr:UDP-3-O-(3-hydroxymyristoyl)glucosamine N-acyltransferase [Candidatus Saganbacteria bacterium]
MKLNKLSAIAAGELVGKEEIDIRGVAPVETAGAGDLVFVLEDKYLAPALSSPAAAVVAPLGAALRGKPGILVKNPRLALAQILPHFAPKPKLKPGVHKTAVVSAGARLGKRVTVGPFVYIGSGVEIGDETVIHPSVTIYDNVKIGKRVVIHAGARIGVDGYGFVWHENKYEKIPQIGTVVIEDDVELFANTCVARGTLGETRVGAGTKIDNLTHLAHNCRLGKHCAITALVGFAGSVTFGDHVSVGGMAGFNGHITIGENTVVMAKSGVTKDIPANSVVSGFPAVNHRDDLEIQASLRRLPEVIKKLKKAS